MSSKTLILAATVASTLTLLAGCSSPSVVHKHDGSMVVTPDRPKYNKETGFYEYKDNSGHLIRLNKTEVDSIEDVQN